MKAANVLRAMRPARAHGLTTALPRMSSCRTCLAQPKRHHGGISFRAAVKTQERVRSKCFRLESTRRFAHTDSDAERHAQLEAEGRAKQTGEEREAKAEGESPNNDSVQRPTRQQIRAHVLQCAIPMIGFGFMDNTVMIHAGNAIDMTLGVTLGLATMTAAGMGQMCSDVAGVLFGGTVDSLASKLGLPNANLNSQQRKMPRVRRWGLFGSCVGVVIGCGLGMVNLLFLTGRGRDDERDDVVEKKIYKVLVENNARKSYTKVSVTGPDSPGILVAMTAAFATLDLNVTHASISTELGHISNSYHINRNEAAIKLEEFPVVEKAVREALESPARALAVAHLKQQQEVAALTAQVEALREALE